MDWYEKRRMEANLAKAMAWLAASLVAVFLIECLWDAALVSGRPDESPGTAAHAATVPVTDAFSQDALLAFALEGDAAAVGINDGAPPDFLAECFSPAMVGDAYHSQDGSVVAISSALEPADLFALCSDALQSHGWFKVDSGTQLRATFVKETGRYRWLFLDAASAASTGTTVIVLEEES